MKIGKNDSIVGADVIPKGAHGSALLAMSENGYGKQTALSEYKVQKRGGSGIKTFKVTPKTGLLISTKVLTPEHDELVTISEYEGVLSIANTININPTIPRANEVSPAFLYTFCNFDLFSYTHWNVVSDIME